MNNWSNINLPRGGYRPDEMIVYQGTNTGLSAYQRCMYEVRFTQRLGAVNATVVDFPHVTVSEADQNRALDGVKAAFRAFVETQITELRGLPASSLSRIDKHIATVMPTPDQLHRLGQQHLRGEALAPGALAWAWRNSLIGARGKSISI